MNIYLPFKNKLENLLDDQQFRVLISFTDLSKRDNFIKENGQLKILGKIDFMPSLLVRLNKEQIFNYQSEEIIKNIQEDQVLYPSMLDVIEMLELNEYRNSEIAYSGKNVKVGIIDNGINKEVSAISNISIKKYRIYEKEKYVKKNGAGSEITHATIMASIICNKFENNDNNYVGIAPSVSIIDFDISNSINQYSLYHILTVFDKIDKEKINIDILFIPLTTKDSSDGEDLLSLACNLLTQRNIMIVCPTGNFGPNNYTIGSPGAAKNVITIGALTKDLKISNFCGRGPTLDERIKPDLYFPGSNVIVPISDNLRLRVSGTSISAVICVGVIALIKEYDPDISYKALINLLKESSIDLNYKGNTQSIRTLKVTDIFSKLDLFHEKLVPYNYLIKKSLTLSIGFLILVIILFYFFYFFRI
ncbi:MAG: S8 family serine peptidase [Promethearchaeota archaeon]